MGVVALYHQFRQALNDHISDLSDRLEQNNGKMIEAEIEQVKKLLAMTKVPQMKRALNKQLARLQESIGKEADEKELRERLTRFQALWIDLSKHPEYQEKKRRGRKPGRKPKNPLV